MSCEKMERLYPLYSAAGKGLARHSNVSQNLLDMSFFSRTSVDVQNSRIVVEEESSCCPMSNSPAFQMETEAVVVAALLEFGKCLRKKLKMRLESEPVSGH